MDPKRNESIDAPDFVARYPVDYDTTEGEHVGITPRMAYYLWAGAQILQDDWNDAIRDAQACELHAESLPPIARPYAHGEWLQQFTNCFTNLTHAIAAGEPADGTYSTCTGEDIALHLVIEYVAAAVTDDVLQLPDELDDTYPLYPELDDDYDYLRDLLLADADVLVLYNPANAGIETQRDPLNHYLNIHPNNWFNTFHNEAG